MINKHFFKTLIIFLIILAIGILGVLWVNHFEGFDQTINILNNKPPAVQKATVDTKVKKSCKTGSLC